MTRPRWCGARWSTRWCGMPVWDDDRDAHDARADGTELSHTEAGDGPRGAAWCTHITESHESWRPMQRLATTHRVIAMDLRGHGGRRTQRRTPAEDVIAVAEEQGRTGRTWSAISSAVPWCRWWGRPGAAGRVTRATSRWISQPSRLRWWRSRRLRHPGVPPGDRWPVRSDGRHDARTRRAGPHRGPRRPDQEVALGVWGLLLSNRTRPRSRPPSMRHWRATPPRIWHCSASIPATGTKGGSGSIDGAVVEVWPDHGHYHPTWSTGSVRGAPVCL